MKMKIKLGSLKTLIRETIYAMETKSAVTSKLPQNIHISTCLKNCDINESTESEIKRAACCLIFNDQGQILSVSRKDNPMLCGLPGGKVDPGESPIQAAARELKEETGLIAEELTKLFVLEDATKFQTTTYLCKVKGDINTTESGVIRWVSPKALTNSITSPFADYNKRLFSAIGLKY